MSDAIFIPLEEIEPADLATCRDGLFQSATTAALRNVLVTTFGQTRYVVYLEDPKGAMFVPLPDGGGRSHIGILWPEPKFEVDPSTLYNPEVQQEALGDLILTPKPAIFARASDGWFNDGQRTPLWGDEAPQGKPIGARSWRLVSVKGERRRIIFERQAGSIGAAE